MDREWNVLHHHQHVGHRYAGEQEVDGVTPHVLVCEDENVDEVEEDAEDADGDGKVAVYWLVGSLQHNSQSTVSSSLSSTQFMSWRDYEEILENWPSVVCGLGSMELNLLIRRLFFLEELE